jgi:hypothetical protein
MSAIAPESVSRDRDIGWTELRSVLEGTARPIVGPPEVSLAVGILREACDVCIAPGHFDVWHPTRPHHVQYPFEGAAPVLHYLMRSLSLPHAGGARVGVIERARLGAEHEARAVWILPSEEQIEILVREAAASRAIVATAVPEHGAWAVPERFPRNRGLFVAAHFPCPHCRVQPEQFEELPSERAFLCPACGESFVPRISRF